MVKILVCNPEFYGIEYSINPWMNIENQADRQLAVKQWTALISILKSIGAEVIEMPGEKNLPDMVFTANAGLYVKDGYLNPDGKPIGQIYLSNFKHPERQLERKYYHAFLKKIEYDCLVFGDDINFEGAGDCLIFDNVMYCGYGFRSDVETYDYFFDINKHILKLVNPYFYHLDTCFCPLPKGMALIYPPAFEDISHIKLKLLVVPENEAKHFACNAVCINNNVIIPSNCPETTKLLEDNGFKVYSTDMSEFIKAGGACKCLTLRLD